ncbi:MAG: glycosyltransferase [Nanoarchaeota archaeon]
MISVIITAYHEEHSIGKAIQAVLDQKVKNCEILVIAPDDATLQAAKKYRQVKVIQDPGKGKPAALNLAFSQVNRKSAFLILTDGDVFLGKDAIKNLIQHFDPEVGAVSGHPISLSPRKTLLGYASHNFTDWWDWIRKKREKTNQILICSGYLFALRAGIIKKIPEDALSDDAVMSYEVYKKGWKIRYAPDAQVYVKYPTTFSDWLKQKRRSAGGYLQTRKYFKNMPTTRSFWKETQHATLWILWYPRNVREIFYTMLLFALRTALWGAIYLDKIRKKSFSQIWQPVESTK